VSKTSLFKEFEKIEMSEFWKLKIERIKNGEWNESNHQSIVIAVHEK